MVSKSMWALRRREGLTWSKSAFADVLVRREAQREAQQVFNVKLSNEGKPITNQKSALAELELVQVQLASEHYAQVTVITPPWSASPCGPYGDSKSKLFLPQSCTF
jgi:hypothetical protein